VRLLKEEQPIPPVLYVLQWHLAVWNPECFLTPYGFNYHLRNCCFAGPHTSLYCNYKTD